MSLSNNFPAVRPTLLLDFASQRVLDPRITFSRASPATYYDGETFAKAEENLALYSQEFNQSPWTTGTFFLTVSANSIAAPDTTTTADTITANAGAPGGNAPYIGYSASVVGAGVVVSASMFARKNTHDFFQLWLWNQGANSYANFNLATGALGTAGAGVTNHTITAIGGGWYRCTMTFTTVSTSCMVGAGIVASASATRLAPWTTAGTESIYIWGAQLEQRSSVTAYTPTTTQPITNYVPVLLTAPANTARFDHNPTTGESLGLMKESERTNLLTYSIDFSNASWSKSDLAITSNIIVAPDGTVTGSKYIPNSLTTAKFLFKNVSITASTALTLSMYIKAGEYNNCVLYFDGLSTGRYGALFDLSNQTATVGSLNTAGTSSGFQSITPVGNGWYRCVVGFTDTALNDGSIQVVARYTAGSAGYPAVTGNDFSGFYIWGAQLEAATNASSFIATTATEVIRLRDDISMTGANFTSWFNNAEGTLLLDIIKVNTEPSNRFSAALFTSSTQYIGLDYNTDPASPGNAYWRVASVITTTGTVSGANMTGGGKYILTYIANDMTITAQGQAVVSAAPTTAIPVMSQLNLGAQSGSSFERTLIYFRKVAYYDVRLTNAQLQTLTRNQ